MSSSFRNPGICAAGLCGAAVAALVCAPPVSAQQIAFVPQAEATAEWASNRILTIPATSASDESIKLGGDLLRISPRSNLDLRPLLTFQNGSIRNLDNIEALVDFAGDYRTLKGEYTLNSEYHREDAYNAQYGVAGFNTLNPNVPDTAGTGAVVTGLTKSTYLFDTGFSYKFTQRWGIEGSANFDAVRYSTDISGDLVSYNSPYVGLDLVWVTSQTSQLGIGPYYTRFDPIRHDVGAQLSDDYGISASYRIRTSQLSTSTITARLERDRSPLPGSGNDTTTTWALEWVGLQKFLTSALRYSVGRFLEPSSFGGRTTEDQARVQYTRTLSERLLFNSAVRFTRYTDVGNQNAGTRNRGNADLSLRVLITPLWYVSGGYRFAYQNLPSQPHAASSNGVFITVGYHGREPPSN